MKLATVWKLLVVVGLFVALIVFFPPLRLSALVITGRSPVCPFSRALASEENLRDQIARKDRILKASKMLEKDAQGFEHWQTPMGNYWISDGSRYVLPFNLAEQDRKIYGTGAQAVQPGDVVLDCGAHVGTFARQALAAGASLVVAIEPAPENLECLRRNLAEAIRDKRAVIYPKGVWDKDDLLAMNVDHGNSAANSFVMHPHDSHTSETKMALTTIDKIVAELKLEKVNYIKMDIEGAEVRALQGGRETLARFHPRISVAAYHEADHAVTIPPAIRAAWPGYQMDCGPCARAGTKIRPDILYFHP